MRSYGCRRGGYVKKIVFLFALILLTMPAHAQDADRALRPDSAFLPGVGSVRTDFSVEFLHRARFSLSGLEGDQLRFGIIDIRVGAGEYAEFQLSGVARDFLSITKRHAVIIPTTFLGDSTSDYGDLILGTKFKLAGEKGHRPALAFKFAVQLPNASNESGLGADETEFYSGILAAKHLGRVRIEGNVGLAILGSAVRPNTQADMLTYGVGVELPLNNKIQLVGEIYGRQGPLRAGNENLARLRTGARIHAAGLIWTLTGIAGLRDFDPKSGICMGVSYSFQAFHKNRGPATVKPKK
jgi:hypothetical protein